MNVINYLGWETCLLRQNFLLRPIEGQAGGSGWPKFGSVLETKGKIFKAVQDISTTSHIPAFLATTSGAL